MLKKLKSQKTLFNKKNNVQTILLCQKVNFIMHGELPQVPMETTTM